MSEHMINWKKVVDDMARITPKGKNRFYGYYGISSEYMVVVNGDRNLPVIPILFYSIKRIPVYGF